MTEPLHIQDAYLNSCEATVTAVNDGAVTLDRSVFLQTLTRAYLLPALALALSALASLLLGLGDLAALGTSLLALLLGFLPLRLAERGRNADSGLRIRDPRA